MQEIENMNKRQKILIVDDAKFNRDILKEFLGETYDYLEAENGNQAIQMIGENIGINLMLLDINMPHSDDEELVRENYKEMEKAANHLLSLINDVLQMSKLEDGREELSSELVCLPDVFYDMKAIIDG